MIWTQAIYNKVMVYIQIVGVNHVIQESAVYKTHDLNFIFNLGQGGTL